MGEVLLISAENMVKNNCVKKRVLLSDLFSFDTSWSHEEVWNIIMLQQRDVLLSLYVFRVIPKLIAVFNIKFCAIY